MDRIDVLIDLNGTVVPRHVLDVRRSGVVTREHLAIDRLRYGAIVLPDQHENCAQHHFTAVLRRRTSAQLAPDADFAYVADANCNTINVIHNDVTQIAKRSRLSRYAEDRKSVQ